MIIERTHQAVSNLYACAVLKKDGTVVAWDNRVLVEPCHLVYHVKSLFSSVAKICMLKTYCTVACWGNLLAELHRLVYQCKNYLFHQWCVCKIKQTEQLSVGEIKVMEEQWKDLLKASFLEQMTSLKLT